MTNTVFLSDFIPGYTQISCVQSRIRSLCAAVYMPCLPYYLTAEPSTVLHKTRLMCHQSWTKSEPWEISEQGETSKPMTDIHVNLIRCSRTLALLCETQFEANKLNQLESQLWVTGNSWCFPHWLQQTHLPETWCTIMFQGAGGLMCGHVRLFSCPVVSGYQISGLQLKFSPFFNASPRGLALLFTTAEKTQRSAECWYLLSVSFLCVSAALCHCWGKKNRKSCQTVPIKSQ